MPSRIDRGDAEAVLNTFGTGGWVILLHSREAAEASQADWFGSHASSGRFRARHGTVGTSAPKTGM
jgi:hypothetical protein